MNLSNVSPEAFARQMARREIVFYRPEPHWQNGLVIGNGDLGASVFAEADGGGLGITLNKVDVWDERYDRRGHRYHTLAELRRLVAEHAGTEEGRQRLRALEPYCVVGRGAANEWYQQTYPYAYAPPTPKPVGRLRLRFGPPAHHFEQRLSVHRAEVRCATETEAGPATAAAHIDAHTNVLEVRVRRSGAGQPPLVIEFARYMDEQLGEPEVRATATGFIHRYQFPGGLVYAVAGVVQASGPLTPSDHTAVWRDWQARNGWIKDRPGFMRNWDEQIEAPDRMARVEAAGPGEVSLFLAVVTSHEAADPLAAAQTMARQAAAEAQTRRAAHLAWWDGFWRASSLRLSDRLVETLWYQGLYVLALQSRGRLPPSLIGPGYYLPHAGWNGHFITDFNIQMNAWPIYTANHLALGQPIFDFFRQRLDVMRAETQALYGLDGVKIPGICVGDGRELSYLPCRLWQSSSAWVAQLYWWAYAYSQDINFLREIAYPLLREVAIFYRGYAQRGADGRDHIFPSMAPEQGVWWATDPAIDLALIRAHLAATLRAAALLDEDADLCPGWQDLLDHLAEIPVKDGVIVDERDATPDKRLGHAGLLMAVFSAGLIGVRSSEAEKALARRSLANAIAHTSRTVVDFPLPVPTWNDDCNWPYLLLVAARLGMKDETRAYLYDYGLLQHLKPNGLLAFDCPISEAQRATRWGMPDSSHALTAAISEMLLQSYDGIIHVAPAAPADWDFELAGFQAVGGFEVAASVAAGQVVSLTIASRCGQLCRVANPWPGQKVRVAAGGHSVTPVEADGVLSFETVAGESYTLTLEGTPAAAPVFTDGAGEPLTYVGPAYLWNIAPSERLPIRLGLAKNEGA